MLTGDLENITYKESLDLGMFHPDTKRSYKSLKLHEMILLTAFLLAVLHIYW